MCETNFSVLLLQKQLVAEPSGDPQSPLEGHSLDLLQVTAISWAFVADTLKNNTNATFETDFNGYLAKRVSSDQSIFGPSIMTKILWFLAYVGNFW